MTHIKKYWLGYLLLIIAIYIGYELYKTNSQLRNAVYGDPAKGTSTPNITVVPVDGKCPEGYKYIELNCITTPCNGMCWKSEPVGLT